MIEPGKNGRRSVAKGRCEAGCFAKNERPLVRWILGSQPLTLIGLHRAAGAESTGLRHRNGPFSPTAAIVRG